MRSRKDVDTWHANVVEIRWQMRRVATSVTAARHVAGDPIVVVVVVVTVVDRQLEDLIQLAIDQVVIRVGDRDT